MQVEESTVSQYSLTCLLVHKTYTDATLASSSSTPQDTAHAQLILHGRSGS
jgi:hypothetical protein